MKFTADEAALLGRILTWRRDVRHFRTDPVPEPILAELQAAMALAPSVGNARPWRVLRVEDPGLRRAVAAEFARCNAAAAAAYDPGTRAEYVRLKLAGLDAAPVQLAVFTRTDPAAGRGLGRQTMPETLRQSTAMAVHTLWLAARARNLGLGMVSILDPRVMERLFAVPAGWEFGAYLCIGWPETEDDTPLLHRTGWQCNQPTEWRMAAPGALPPDPRSICQQKKG
ncbi:5,6-dimethylbenzimidazole synthase [Albidovulum sp.]